MRKPEEYKSYKINNLHWEYGGERGIRTLSHAFCRLAMPPNALGQTDAARQLHVTFTLRRRGTLIRVISARDMHRKERKIYEQS
jgi:hypothetical protein